MSEFSLRRLKGQSFETDNPEAFCHWLGEQNIAPSERLPGPHEFARMERAGE